MKKPLTILCLGLSFAGCADKPAAVAPNAPVSMTAPAQDAVATVNGQPITAETLNKPLYEAYGLNMLLSLVQLESAKQSAAKNHVAVTEDDVQTEFKSTLATMFEENNAKGLAEIDKAEAKGDKAAADKIRQAIDADNQQLLDQFLLQQKVSRAEFEIVMRTNAYLRKIVEPTLKDAITDQMLQDGFRFQYGEKVHVRHIQCANWRDIAKAKQMLADGQSFADVATAISTNPRTAPIGGDLRPFSRQEPALSDAFKDAAFALKVGEVSEPVMTNGAYHIIKLEERIQPKAVKFEDVKEAVRKQLYDSLVANSMKQLRNALGQDAIQTLKITDPTLKAQYDKRTADAKSTVKGREDTRKKLTEEREAADAAIATQPTSMPAPATMPAPVTSTAPAAK